MTDSGSDETTDLNIEQSLMEAGLTISENDEVTAERRHGGYSASRRGR